MALHKFIDENLTTGLIQALLFSPWSSGSFHSEKRWLSSTFASISEASTKDLRKTDIHFHSISNLLMHHKSHESTPRSTSDMHYHLVWISPGDNGKTAFWTRVQFLRVVGNAWKGLLAHPLCFKDLWMTFSQIWLMLLVIIYLDDILIYSDNISEHKGPHLGSTLQTPC